MLSGSSGSRTEWDGTGEIDRVATHILAFEGDSYVHWFNGNFSSYQDRLRRRKGKEADQPQRIKYRKLTRH